MQPREPLQRHERGGPDQRRGRTRHDEGRGPHRAHPLDEAVGVEREDVRAARRRRANMDRQRAARVGAVHADDGRDGVERARRRAVEPLPPERERGDPGIGGHGSSIRRRRRRDRRGPLPWGYDRPIVRPACARVRCVRTQPEITPCARGTRRAPAGGNHDPSHGARPGRQYAAPPEPYDTAARRRPRGRRARGSSAGRRHPAARRRHPGSAGRRPPPDRGRGQRHPRARRGARGRPRLLPGAVRRRRRRDLAAPATAPAVRADREPGPRPGADRRRRGHLRAGRRPRLPRDPRATRDGAGRSGRRAAPRADLRAARVPDRQLRPAAVPRREGRPAGPVPPGALRLDAGRARAVHVVREPDGHGLRERPPVRQRPRGCRPPAGDPGALVAAQPDPGRRGHRQRDRGRGGPPDPARHDPRLRRRPGHADLRADRVPRRVQRHRQALAGRAAAADRRGADGLGRPAQRDDPHRRRRERPARQAGRPGPRRGVDAAGADVLRVARPGRDRRVQERLRPVHRGRPADARDLRRLRGPGRRQRRGVRAGLTPARGAPPPAREPAAPARGQRATPRHPRPERRARDDRGLAQGGHPVRRADRLPRRPRDLGPARGPRPRPVRRPDHAARGPARRRHHRLGDPQRRGGARQRRAPRSALDQHPRHARGAGVDARRSADRGRRRHRHPQRRPHGGHRVALHARRVRARPAVRGPGVDRAPERRGARRGDDPGRARRADRAAQPRRLPARARAADRAGPAVRPDDARPRRVQGLQRLARPSRGRRAARADRARHVRRAARRRPRLPLRRRRVRDPAAGHHERRDPRGHRPDPDRRRAA